MWVKGVLYNINSCIIILSDQAQPNKNKRGNKPKEYRTEEQEERTGEQRYIAIG